MSDEKVVYEWTDLDGCKFGTDGERIFLWLETDTRKWWFPLGPKDKPDPAAPELARLAEELERERELSKRQYSDGEHDGYTNYKSECAPTVSALQDRTVKAEEKADALADELERCRDRLHDYDSCDIATEVQARVNAEENAAGLARRVAELEEGQEIAAKARHELDRTVDLQRTAIAAQKRREEEFQAMITRLRSAPLEVLLDETE